MNLKKYLFGILYIFFVTGIVNNVNAQKAVSEPVKQVDARPSPRPDRIILTWQTDPKTSQTVTWRTDNTVKTPRAEIAVADASPLFTRYATSYPAKTNSLKTENGVAFYHKVNFINLKPSTLYAYRVGDGNYWSEWYQFKTASDKPEAFSFIYFGDAQTELFSLWSRTIRAAYAEAPKAKFMLHAGDLINDAESDTQWQEWFKAGGFIHATIPGVPLIGNHEYGRVAGIPKLTPSWKLQFNLPENGPVGMQDEAYYFDYQDTRFICLNSYFWWASQAKWLENILKNNPKKWTVVAFHYPVFSGARGREDASLGKHWKPILDKYKVDLVLQGHDHIYARGTGDTTAINSTKKENKPGPVYVTSVAGPKMYNIKETKWFTRSGENTQLYQVITIDGDKLLYKSITVTGELYDGFSLHKKKNGPNELIEIKPDIQTERRFNNTLKNKP